VTRRQTSFAVIPQTSVCINAENAQICGPLVDMTMGSCGVGGALQMPHFCKGLPGACRGFGRRPV